MTTSPISCKGRLRWHIGMTICLIHIRLYHQHVNSFNVGSYSARALGLTTTGSYRRLSNSPIRANQSDNNLSSNDDNMSEQLQQQASYRQRRPDYPSFAYLCREDPKSKKGKEYSQNLIRFQNKCGKEVVFSPDKGDLNNPPDSWIGRMVRGTPLEAAFNTMNESALKTRIRSNRSYSKKEPFLLENIDAPPCSDDLATPATDPAKTFWISPQSRLLSFCSAFIAFPYITHIVDSISTMPPEQLDEISSKFGPGISILYGTFISLTLNILYNRSRTIQDNVGVECSYLVVLTRNLISLFRNNRERAIEAAQCSADQIRTLVRSSRGAELMLLVYSDPYARVMELLDMHESDLYNKNMYDGRSASLIGNSRDVLKDLFKVRANRLSDEAVALPPTHFFILLSLTLLILSGYIVSIIPTLDESGNPPFESSLLFAILSTIYIMFYNFASDLNNPFEGVYQIRRSCVSSHLLQLKWLILNHPLLRGEIDFEETEEEENGVHIYSPGLGDLWFERKELFVKGDVDSEEPVLINERASTLNEDEFL
jgi:Protein of unknown function (DUF4239)